MSNQKIIKTLITTFGLSFLLGCGTLNTNLNEPDKLTLPVSKLLTKGISQTYGNPRFQGGGFQFHSGVDFVQRYPNNNKDWWKTKVRAVRDGVVYDSEGNRIVIQVNESTFDIYYHLRNIRVKTGEEIKSGDKIAEIAEKGDPGYGTIPHLHYLITEGKEVYVAKKEHYFEYFFQPQINPLLLFLKKGLIKDSKKPNFTNIPGFKSPIIFAPDGHYNELNFESYSEKKTGSVERKSGHWVIKGEIDIWVSVNDFMGVTEIAEIKYEIINESNQVLIENWLLNNEFHFCNFSYYLPGDNTLINLDENRKSRLKSYLAIFAPTSIGATPNIYVVTNNINGIADTAGCLNTKQMKNGKYWVKVTAYDLTKNSASHSLEFIVDN